MDATNKLKQLKPNVSPWKYVSSLGRRESIVLTRLRIGHSHLTHSHYFNNQIQLCQCGTQFTIKHIFECANFLAARVKHNVSFGTVFEDSLESHKKLIKFLIEIDLYKRF